MSLDLAYNFWFLICAVFIIIAFTIWIYRTTLPEVSPFLRRSLLILRTLLLLIILLLLFEGQIRILVEKIKKPVLAILLDSSASMQLPDGEKKRGQQALDLLRPLIENATLNENANLRVFSFSDTVNAIEAQEIDSVKFDGDGTDIASAIRRTNDFLTDENIAAVLLLSDGASNLGADPVEMAENLSSPVYTVQTGTETVAKDLWIKDVISNKTAFADAEIPVELYLRAQGLRGTPAKLQIRQDNRILQEQEIAAAGDGLEKKVTLFIKPSGLGKQKFTAVLSKIDGEITGQNNSHAFYMTVRKSKLKIVLLAAAPSPDVAFIKQALDKDKNFTLQQIIAINNQQLTGDALPKAAEIEGIDCIIAVNFARHAIHPQLQKWLISAAGSHEKSLLFLSGPIASTRQLNRFRAFLRLAGTPQITREKQVLPRLSNQGMLHPLFKTDEATEMAQLDVLPPVFSQVQSLKFQPNSVVLATARALRNTPLNTQSEEPPLIAATKSGNQRVISIWANGIWRWNLLLQRTGQAQFFYENFIQNCIRWLASRDENKRLAVKPSGDIFRSGEQIEFVAQACYDDYRVQENLQISLEIRGGETARVEFSEQGNGIYRSSPGILPAGDYQYFARARENGAIVSADSGKFSVIPFQWELQNTGANGDLLRRLATTSGGLSIARDSLGNWLAGLKFVPEKRREFYEIKLWQHWSLFVILISLLALEWFIRKQKGML